MTSRPKIASIREKSNSKHQNTSFLSRNQPLQIIPPEIVFKDIQINQFYEITVEIRNLTNKATRIRFQKVQNNKIQLIYTMQPEIAPGLSTTARIKYQCNQLVNETDIIKIVSQDGYIVELPVRVYKMESQILFQPFINMGFIKIGKQHQEVIAIKNLGKAPGTVQFSHNYGSILSVEPKILKIAPKEESKIVVKYKSSQAGLFKGFIQLTSDSILVKNQIDIHATTVDYARFIVDAKGTQTSSFDFGIMSVGQEVKLKAFLVNNSPKIMKFKTFFRKGFLTSTDEFAMVQTPSEIGLQQSERVMFCSPESGQIQAFSQLQIQLICRTRITYRDKIYANTFALTPSETQNNINHKKNSNEFKPENTYDYSVMLTCEADEPILMQLKAVAVCPQIKISNNIFKFGDCPAHEKRSQKFIVENKNSASKTQISFPKIPNFLVLPQNYTLTQNQKMQFTLIFEPKSIGKVDTNQLLIINKLYEIQLRCFGISTTGSSTKIKDQTPNKRNKAFSLTQKTFKPKNAEEDLVKLKLSSLHQNKDKFNQYLVDRRIQRKDQQKQEVVQKKWTLYQTKLRDLGTNSRLQQRLDDEGLPSNPPIDYQFQTGMLETGLEKQFIPMPIADEPLFVTRHIGQYQPPVSKHSNSKYNPDINTAVKKIFPENPQNYNHRRQITRELTSVQLEQIQVGTNVVNFGQVFIKSKSSRYFWIRNSTKKAISVRLKIKDNELQLSYKKAQIVQSGHEAGFELVFNKDTLGDFKSTMKYVINQIHQFQMTITAKSVPVNIQLDKESIKFTFQENSLEFKKTENITLYNPGNSDAFFKFTLSKQKYFVPEILERSLKSKEKLIIPINFVVPIPTVQKADYNYSQKLILKILDGSEASISCSSYVVCPKYTIKANNISNLVMCIGHEIEETIQVKNNSKNTLILYISGKVLDIDEKVKLNPQQNRKFKVRYEAKEVGVFDGEILFQARGGKNKTLQSKITCIQPKIQFSQLKIEMGLLVVQGIPGKSQFSCWNKSIIDIPLIIDLRPKTINPQNPQGVENINLKLKNQDISLQIVNPGNKNDLANANTKIKKGQNLVGIQVDEQQFDGSQEDEQTIVQKNQDEYRKYKLILKPQKQYIFQMEFFPKESRHYIINIPMMIEGSEKISGPSIFCQGIKPQFLFEPNIIDFKRKIVTRPDRCYPKYINVIVKNLDNQEVSWELVDEQIKKSGVFTIEFTKGVLKPLQTLQFKVGFNPYVVSEFDFKLPLFIRTSKHANPLKCVDVLIKGSACLPRLYFNKRQVILPVVPLGIETTSSFRILNDGYQNTNLKMQFLDDVAGINVRASFPEGPNIGITRQKLKIDLAWKFHKPMSFTLKLQFTDDLNRTFIIPVSGTADNCIFTNYTYLLRNENKFYIKPVPHLELLQIVDPTPGLVRKNSNRSLRSNVTGKSVMSYLGVNPISPSILANTIDYINRYINSNLLTMPIDDFPKSLIEGDGSQLFEIVGFVSAKSTSYPWKYTPTPNEKDSVRVSKIYNQYCQFIKLLKTEGAHLNHIRPQYLLSFSDLNVFLANLPQEKAQYYMPSLLKINTGLFNYLSMDSWITLLYQILKIYVLGRVTPKNIKAHLNNKLPEIPKYYLEGSNFSSANQNILFLWVEQAILEVLLEERRLTNFDKDFKDGVAIAALIQKYANFPILKKLKMVCTLEEDFKQNAVFVCQALAEIGLLNHITAKDIYNPLQREMLLLILHLYVYLPFYTPKQEPVLFKCILGEQVLRSIELNNPSSKPVTYSVRYEGSEDFELIGEKKFKIQSKQTYKFQIKFVSRVSTPVKGRIMFINVKQNTLTAAALVFQLKSQIIGRNSDRIWNISGILYEQVQFAIDVTNKFQSAEIVDFTVTYETQYIFENKHKNKQQSVSLPKSDQIQVIYGKQESIKIRKNGSGSFLLNYVPMSMYTTKTTLLFVNPVVGQFQHQIIGSVEPPATISQLRPSMTLSVDQIAHWQYLINPRNELMYKGRKAIEGLKKLKKSNKDIKDTKDVKLNTQNGVNQVFKVEIAPNPFVSAKDQILITQKKDERKKDKQVTEIVTNQNKIPFTIVCKNPVYEYSTYVLISNKTKTDIRRYKIIFTVQPKPLKAILEMNVPARSQVTQNLPIVNNTQRDWAIKVVWQPDTSKNGGYFQINSSYSSQFPVKRNSVGNFPITFKPKWANRAQAKLTMTNPLTLDHFQYEIIGLGEEPLAEEHIEIKCQAKQLIKKQLIIKNPYIEKQVVFNVQTDLLNFKGPTKISIPPGSKEKYEFTLQPMLCGEYTGSITFAEEDGPQYVWYTVSIITNYPEAFQVLDFISEIREPKIIDLQIPLHIKQPTNFQVIINGQGLNGSPTFLLEPGKNEIYKIQYLPLKVGQEKGSVCFINPQIGQTLYELNLRCNPKLPIVINNLKSPLGVSTYVVAELVNPTNHKVFVKVSNTNPQLFVIKSNSFKLGPQQKLAVQIQYVPSSLQVQQTAHIKFMTNEIGDWEYEISGSGQAPVPFPPYVVYNGLFEEHSDSLKFRNPFKYAIVVGVKFSEISQPNIFKLLNHGKDRFEIDSFGNLQIPFSFIPKSCKLYQCKIIVMISQKIFWTFPVKGITEVNKGNVICHLTTKCRQTTSQSVQIPLEGIQNYVINNQYKFELQNIPTNYKTLIEKFLIIQSNKTKLNHSKDFLEFQFIFKPMKPGKVSLDFLISRKQGSRWRYKLILQATQPQPDDIIEIQSNLLVTSTVSFKLTNWQKNQSTFKAKFTSDSAHQFSVEPKEGVLKGFGGKGTSFFVSYTPVQYGKDKRGKLIIQTPDMFWSYVLKGSLPKYIPPSNQTRSRIQSIKK